MVLQPLDAPADARCELAEFVKLFTALAFAGRRIRHHVTAFAPQEIALAIN
jgi:hypothetical protein